MKKIRQLIYFLYCFVLLGIVTPLKAQDAYWTEGFESTNITGSSGSAYTAPTSITTETGNWTFYYAYRAGSFCEGSKGLRLLKSQNAYAVTPVLPDGLSRLTFKEPANQVRTFHIYATPTTSGDMDWKLLTTVVTNNNGACANLYEVNTSNYASVIAPAAIRRIKIVNEGTGDANLDVLTLYKATQGVSSDVEVLSFKINGQIGQENISYGNGTIDINVASGTDLNTAPTAITLSSGATITPAKEVVQDFSSPITYTVLAEDGTTTKDWVVTVHQILSSEKEITDFKLSADQIGSAAVNSASATILVTMPIGTSITNLIPLTLGVSAHATVNPAIGAALDFSSNVVYTVTAQDGTTKNWTVSVVFVDPNQTFTTYEAEDADFTGKVDTQHAGFSGSGFIDFLSGGDNQITFAVCQQTTGVQTMKIRYAFAKDDDRTAELYVNNVFIQNVSFPKTGALFTDWSDVLVAINLQAGVNNIQLTWDLTDGPNLDKIELSGAPCTSYTVNVTTDNEGIVSFSPKRRGNKYYDGEEVTLLAEEKANLKFLHWGGDLLGTENPKTFNVDGNKNITAQFQQIQTYKVNITVNGIGEVSLSPAGGEYTAGTEVTLTAKSILGSTFENWGGALSGSTAVQVITVSDNKNIIANFSSNDIQIDFKTPIGFAAANGDGFNGPTTGGDANGIGTKKDTVYINGPSEFDKLCQILKDRIKYKGISNNPLTIVLEPGVYPDVPANGISVWGNHMLDIQEQANLTIIGRKNVVLNFGINVKRSQNIIIRNITFQDYYDDGINIGNTETNHIWVDHCTVGHPTTMPVNTEHPDGGIDIKDGASYVTVSWTIYRNSWKTGLIGHSDNNGAKDIGRLKVTHYANHYLHTNSRNPRVRFGEVHVLNCLGENIMLYGIAASNLSQVYAENNFYLNSRWPMYADRASADFNALYQPGNDATFSSKTGNKVATGLKQIGNEYDDSGLPVITSKINPAMLNPGGRSVKFDEFNPEQVFDPKTYYSYTAFPASAVKTLIPMFAGADKIDWFPDETLPIEFTDFKAQVEKSTTGVQQVRLSWKVLNQDKADRFEIIKIQQDREEVVQSVKADGSAFYTAIDKQPYDGTSYYKLRQYDRNGERFESDLKVVKIGGLSNLTLYPNPAEDFVMIGANTGSQINIYSIDGKIMQQVNETLTNQVKVDVSAWKPGVYLVEVVFEMKKEIFKMIKK